MTRNRDAYKIREHMRRRLYVVARNHLTYPEVHKAGWFLPQIGEWEPYLADENDRMFGWYIVPSIVVFTVPPVDQLDASDISKFRLDLERSTGARWHMDDNDLPLLLIIAIRLSRTVIIRNEAKQSSTTFYLPYEEGEPQFATYQDVNGRLILDAESA